MSGYIARYFVTISDITIVIGPVGPDTCEGVPPKIAAKKPVIIAGGGTNISGARKKLINISEKLNIPVATSLNAKEVFPYDHPLAVGIPGSYSRSCANKIVAESDLIFFIGSHTGSQITNNWRLPRKGTDHTTGH